MACLYLGVPKTELLFFQFLLFLLFLLYHPLHHQLYPLLHCIHPAIRLADPE